MIKTYRNFKRSEEIFCGLSIVPLLQIAVISTLLIYFAISIQLDPSSPLFLLLAVIWMIVVAFIIKAAQGEEVRGFYSSILLHPFANHIFSLDENDQTYQSVGRLLPVKDCSDNYIVTKEDDLLAVIKLNNSIARNKLSNEELLNVIKNWGDFLAQFKSISDIGAYNSSTDIGADLMQLFVWVKPYKLHPTQLQSLVVDYADQIYQYWLSQMFDNGRFIQDLQFYIVIRQQSLNNKVSKVIKILRKFLPMLAHNKYSGFEDDLRLLLQKVEAVINALARIGINSNQLKGTDLLQFYNHWLPNQKSAPAAFLQDNGKFIKQFDGRYSKTYRVHLHPSSGNLELWIEDLIKELQIESSVAIYLEPRDSLKDRRQAERKAELMRQLSNNNRSTTMAIMKENKELALDLLNLPYSFDLSIFITIYARNSQEIQYFDSRLRKPIKEASIAGLDRQQIANWIYSLPFAANGLSNQDKLFAGLDFARATFPFVKEDLGTVDGPLMGLSMANSKPVFVDEYDRTLFNNRGINFIGDSGSGKTVAAKLAVKRRLQDQDRSFYIIDSTEDGWQFFVDYFGGDIVYLDKFLEFGSLFNPFVLPLTYTTAEFQQHLEDMTQLLAFIRSSQGQLQITEKFFLQQSLNAVYAKGARVRLSDLYDFWKRDSNSLAELWSNIIAPFCYQANGVYAYLLDGYEASFDAQSKLILFTFFKPYANQDFVPLAMFLINHFVSHKVIFQKQARSTLIVDEAWKIFTNNNQLGRDLLVHFARAGRGLDLGLWTISQKPSDLPREVHSSASMSLCFQLKELRDRQEMAVANNLSETELKLLSTSGIYDSGTCLMKTTRNSGLLKVLLDPVEQLLCNSTRDFVNKRNSLFVENLNKLVLSSGAGIDSELKKQAARITIKFLLEESP